MATSQTLLDDRRKDLVSLLSGSIRAAGIRTFDEFSVLVNALIWIEK